MPSLLNFACVWFASFIHFACLYLVVLKSFTSISTVLSLSLASKWLSIPKPGPHSNKCMFVYLRTPCWSSVACMWFTSFVQFTCLYLVGPPSQPATFNCPLQLYKCWLENICCDYLPFVGELFVLTVEPQHTNTVRKALLPHMALVVPFLPKKNCTEIIIWLLCLYIIMLPRLHMYMRIL